MRQWRQRTKHAGIAHQDIQPAPTLVKRGAQAVESGIVGEIERRQRRLAAHFADLVVELGKRALALLARHGDDMCTLGRIGLGHGAADAARGAGDDGDPSVQSPPHLSFPSRRAG